MPLRLDCKKLLSARSDRVKSVDFHSSEPWVLAALYSGNIFIWDYNSQTLVKSIEVSNLPIRCAKFITRKQWIVTGCDDMNIRTYNYNTLEKVKVLEAHTDYIRFLAVHPSLPYVLSASDDMTVKMWDWEKNWTAVQTFESHAHYVMMVQWNPKDTSIFASASLDRSIKVWGITTSAGSAPTSGSSPTLSISPTGTSSTTICVNKEAWHAGSRSKWPARSWCIVSFSGDKPYIISGSDDRTVRVWDYQTKQCIQVLTGHSNNVSAAVFHPNLPIIISGSEDGSVRIWHSSTYRLETSLNYMMERLWSIGVSKGSNSVALGYDEGTIVIKLGSETPLASMTTGGKIVWAKGSDIQTANLKLVDEVSSSDGERLPLAVKDMGSCELFPQSLAHAPNGRLFAVCGDGEYIIYTAQALRNKSFGSAVEFVWSDEGHFATKDSSNKISIFHNFKEVFSFKPPFHAEELFGGRLLGVRSSDFICFFDMNTDFRLIRRIDVVPRLVLWSENGDQVALCCADAFYILKHDKDAISAAIAGHAQQEEDGYEAAFELIQEVSEKVDSGLFVSDCFVYVANMRLQCSVAGQIETLAHLDRPMYIIGYMPEHNKIFLIDRELSVVSYMLHVALIEYQTAICRKDFDSGQRFFEQIPESLHNRVARFLEHQGHKDQALSITKDLDHQFDLALSLSRLEQCAQIIKTMASDLSTAPATVSVRWRQLGDTALEQGNFTLALACFKEARDFSGLLLMYSASGDEHGLRQLAEEALALPDKRNNVALLCYLLLRDTERTLEVLINAGRLPEAAFFARTYCPSQVGKLVQLWKQDLNRVNKSLADSLADPSEYEDLFPSFSIAREAESIFAAQRLPVAASYSRVKDLLEVDILNEMQTQGRAHVERLYREGGPVDSQDARAPLQNGIFDQPIHGDSPTEREPETDTMLEQTVLGVTAAAPPESQRQEAAPESIVFSPSPEIQPPNDL